MTQKQSRLDQIIDYFILAICVITSIFLLSQNTEEDAIQNFRQSYLELSGEVQSQISQVDNYFELKQKNDSLSLELERAYHENQRFKSAFFELIRLKKTVNIKLSDSLKFIFAEVISLKNSELNKSITINKGLSDSIQINSPVLYKDVLVGRIISISEHFASVQLASDHLFEISVRIDRLGEVASLVWDGNQRFRLLYVSKNIPILKGDLIVTSGLSEIYPKHIKLGLVESINSEISGLYSEVYVKALIDFTSLQYVSVLSKKTMTKSDSILLGKIDE